MRLLMPLPALHKASITSKTNSEDCLVLFTFPKIKPRCMKLTGTLLAVLLCISATYAQTTPAARAKALLAKMTLEEKIGQLNLVTPGGGILTGAVVSQGVEENIRKGNVGGLFGIYGPEKVRKAQDLAVKNSRLHIPLIFGLDV